MLNIFLEATEAPKNSLAGAGIWQSIILWGLIFVAFWFFLIRPQSKKSKQIKEMLNNLKPGDNVKTIGGLYGKIVSIDEDNNVVTIECGENKVKLIFDRRAISQVGDEGVENDELQNQNK